MQFDYKTFSQAIKDKQHAYLIKHRKFLGLRTLASEVGVSASTISRIGNGKKADIDSILALCKWLNQPIQKFIK